MNDLESEVNRISLGRLIFSLVILMVIFAVVKITLDEFGGISKLQDAITQAGPWAPIIYITLKALIYVAAPLSSLPIQISSGALFGLWRGTIYTLIGAIIGGSINFWIARLLGRSVVTWIIGKNGILRVDTLSHQLIGWRILLFARVFLSPLYDFISYAAGLTTLSFSNYVAVSAIGGLIPTVLWVGLGASFAGDRIFFLLASSGIAILYLTVIAFRRQVWNAFLGGDKHSIEKPQDDLPQDDKQL